MPESRSNAQAVSSFECIAAKSRRTVLKTMLLGGPASLTHSFLHLPSACSQRCFFDGTGLKAHQPVRRKAGVALADLMQRTFQLLVQRKCMAGEDRAKSAFQFFCCDAIAQHCSSAFPEAMGLEF